LIDWRQDEARQRETTKSSRGAGGNEARALADGYDEDCVEMQKRKAGVPSPDSSLSRSRAGRGQEKRQKQKQKQKGRGRSRAAAAAAAATSRHARTHARTHARAMDKGGEDEEGRETRKASMKPRGRVCCGVGVSEGDSDPRTKKGPRDE
jgi:hypothetical protein